jgi:serine/threonine-protein kinase
MTSTPLDAASERDDHRDDLLGTLFAGKYQMLERIAVGGMSRVYKAMQLPLGRTVAVKILELRRTDKPEEFNRRFVLEAAALARLRHPNTITAFDFGHDEAGRYFLVTEFVMGTSVARLLRVEKLFSATRALRIAYQVTRSLGEAHKVGIVHRDMKPANLMVEDSEEGEHVKVLDFGVVKMMDDDQDLTQVDQVVGSPRYMAPEQVQNADVDARTDVYALGIVLYEMITGEVPFDGRTTMQLLAAHVMNPVPAMRRSDGKPVPPAVEALVLRCLEKDPARRFASMEALRDGISDVLAQLEPSMVLRQTPGTPDPDPMAVTFASSPTLAPPLRASPRAAGRAPRWPWVLIGLSLGLAVFLFLLPAPSPQVAPAPAAPVAPALPAAAQPTVVQLVTSPAGAQVREGEALLGQTPMSLTVPSEGDIRYLNVRREGYEAVTVEILPGLSSGLMELRLDPVAPARAAPPPRPAARPASKPARAAPQKAAPAKELDIRLER